MSLFLLGYPPVTVLGLPLPTVTVFRPMLHIVTDRYFTVSYRFIQFFLLSEFFGSKQSEKHIKNKKQSNKINNKNTFRVFAASNGYSCDSLAITPESINHKNPAQKLSF